VEFMGCNPPSFSGIGDTKEFLKWFEEIETIFRCGDCRKEDKVKFATCTFQDLAQEWWTTHVKIVGVDDAYSRSWEELRKMMGIAFCVRSELRAIEQEALNLTMVGDDVVKYTAHFYELARLDPAIGEPEIKRLERYVGGLSPEIRMLVIACEPNAMSEAIQMAIEAKELIVRDKTSGNNSNNKRKWVGNQDANATQRPLKIQQVVETFTAGSSQKKGYVGKLPKCNKCQFHHKGSCPSQCGSCQKLGHKAKDCKAPTLAQHQELTVICRECGVVGHFRSECPVLRDRNWRRQFML
jgi:hypothetical protein